MQLWHIRVNFLTQEILSTVYLQWLNGKALHPIGWGFNGDFTRVLWDAGVRVNRVNGTQDYIPVSGHLPGPGWSQLCYYTLACIYT